MFVYDIFIYENSAVLSRQANILAVHTCWYCALILDLRFDKFIAYKWIVLLAPVLKVFQKGNKTKPHIIGLHDT